MDEVKSLADIQSLEKAYDVLVSTGPSGGKVLIEGIPRLDWRVNLGK